MKQLLSLLKPAVCVLCVIVLLTFPNPCILGAQNGLLLWYSKVLPVLLPFFILSSILSNSISFSPILTTLILGVFCGYPMGAKCVKDYYLQGYFSKSTATKLLCVCNHASPMFLIGYVCTMQLQGRLPLSMLLFAIYWPPVLLGLTFILLSYRQNNCKKKAEASVVVYPNSYRKNITLDESIEHSLLLICKIGCYIMLYSILCNLLLTIGAEMENHLTIPMGSLLIPFFTGCLEMTTGIATIANVEAPSILKLALVTAVASFGGCSSISQVKSTIKGTTLPMVPYILSKCICGLLSFLTILVLVKV